MSKELSKQEKRDYNLRMFGLVLQSMNVGAEWTKIMLNQKTAQEEIRELRTERTNLEHEGEVDIFSNGFQKVEGLVRFRDIFIPRS
jgi:hypothetical protein